MKTTKKNLNKEIIALFSGQASIVTTPKVYIQLTGNHSLAVVLNQCVFWSNKSVYKNGWFFKSYDEWLEEIHMPERTLRRRFEKLEEYGWITTKVKMVGGKNIKHIKPNMDNIIDSISIMLNQDCPNRPLCPDGIENEQKPCTKVAPIGQTGRTESAKLAVSYNSRTDEYLQITTTTETGQKLSSQNSVAVVVESKNVENRKPETPGLPENEKKRLTDVYEDSELQTENILCLDDFLSAALYSINDRPENITRQQRLNGIVALVRKGVFEEPPEWAKKQRNIKNRAIGEKNLNELEERSRLKALQVLNIPIVKKQPISAIQATSAILESLTGSATYREDKIKVEKKYMATKQKIESELDKPKKGWKPILMPEQRMPNL